MAMADAVKLVLMVFVPFLTLVPPRDGAVSYYYVTPAGAENQSCTLSNHTLTPCYQLDDLQEALGERLDSVTLLFLPGFHRMSAGYTVNAQYKDDYNFTLAPWKTSLVKIDCLQHASFSFSDVSNLFISSIEFASCTLRYSQSYSLEPPTYAPSAVILNCSFTGRRSHYSLTFSSINSIRVENCTFLGSGGAVWSVETEHYVHKWTEFLVMNSSFLHTAINASAMGLDEGPVPLSGLGNDVPNIGNDGSALHVEGAKLTVRGSRFISGTAAGSGGACHIAHSHAMIEDTTFEENSAAIGGALHIVQARTTLHNCTFRNNSAQVLGGAVYFQGVYLQSDLLITANSTFQFNHAGVSGGAVYTSPDSSEISGAVCFTSFYRSDITISSSYFSHNSAAKGGSLYLASSSLTLESWIEIANNSASEKGGAIYASNSFIDYGSCIFCRLAYNRAEVEGGALFLDASFLADALYGVTAEVHIDHNMVTSSRGRGGAIFAVDKDCADQSSPYHQCFVYIWSVIVLKRKLLFFSNNRAPLGSVLYGGSLDMCVPPSGGSFFSAWSGIEAFKILAEYEPTPLAITSQPKKLCACDDNFNITDCGLRFFNITKMRGERLELRLAVLDQDDNTLPAIIRASYRDVSSALDKGEGSKLSSVHCESFSYHVFTADDEAELLLEPAGPCQQSRLTVHVTIKPCSQGFERNADRCVCDRRLRHYLNITTCDINSDSTESQGSLWLRYDELHLKMSRNCPLDYCQVRTNISFSFPDKQCANHRSGILCGACQDHHSITLGTTACLQCNSYSVWLICVFAVAGIALVAFLLVCNLTISKGTLNGLIFYANVISISGLTSFHNCSIHPVLSVFIAWLNLDLGIQTCFYSGMDTYQKTWLQYCFPLYIWLLVIAIIVASHFSSRAMRLFGRNNVAVLATLFLLSYNKILKTIITALAFSDVLVSKAGNVTGQVVPHKVWTHDGNVGYLEGKHVPLSVVSLFFLVFLFLPYTLLLIIGQCLRSLSVWGRQLPWTRSTAFISILDAYHAPYRTPHRYWTGLMLLTRCLLFLVFATYQQDRVLVTNTFAVTLLVMGIFAIRMHATKIYKHPMIDVLETSFLLNLGFLSATLYYLKGTENANSKLCIAVSASVSLSFLTFLGILIWHVYLQIRKKEWFLSLRSTILRAAQSVIRGNASSESVAGNLLENSLCEVHKNLPTSTVLELREILLVSSNN